MKEIFDQRLFKEKVMVPGTKSLQERIADWFRGQPQDKWIVSDTLIKAFPEASASHVYLVISNLAIKPEHRILKRRPRTDKSGYEYTIDPEATPKAKEKKAVVVKEFHGKKFPSVHWTEDEKRALAKEVVRIKSETPHLPTSDVLIKMQNVLGYNRRRLYLKKSTEVPWLQNYVLDASKELVKEPMAPPVVEVTPPVADVVESHPSPEPPTLETIPIDALIGEIAKRFAVPLKMMLIDVLSSPEIQQLIKRDSSTQEAPTQEAKVEKQDILQVEERRSEERGPKVRIGVVGNQTWMEGELSKSFPHLKFVVSDRKTNEAAEAVRNCDRVIVLTKFVSHPTDHTVRKAVGDRYVPANGGLSEVRRLIQLWINQGVIPKQ